MADIDIFASLLFEEAKRFLEKARETDNEVGKNAYLHAALLIGCSSLEAHINAIADEKLSHRDLDILERSLLSERNFELINGEFVLSDELKIYRLTDRIKFIYKRFAYRSIDTALPWWSRVNEALNKRNALVHAKQQLELSEKTVEESLEAILEFLNDIYNALYKTNYPAFGRKLDSKMYF